MAKKLVDEALVPGKEIPVGVEGWERDRSNRAAWKPAIDPETGLPEASRTEQSHKDSCDINVLMAKYERSGVIPRGASGEPFYGDFTGIDDYQSALNAVMEAEESFMQLPAKIRAQFDNDPQKLLTFLADDKNRQAAIDLGLIDAPNAPAKMAEPPVAPEAPKAPVTPAVPAS